MSSKRVDADLGFLSLALAEIPETAAPVCFGHRSADGLRLRALLAGPARHSSEDVPVAHHAHEEYGDTPRPFDQHQRLKWLAERLHAAHLVYQMVDEQCASLRLPAELLKDSTLEVRDVGHRLIFNLRTGDASARAWLCDKLVELVDVLASRIHQAFMIRIVDTMSSAVVAEAGKEQDSQSCHRALFCEN
jgi:hypothetical protein